MLLSDFDRIECICIDNRRNEWKTLENQFTKRNVTMKKFIVGKGKILPIDKYNQIDDTQPPPKTWVNSTENAYHCYKSHRSVLKRALDDNIKNILMLEDDCKLLDNFDEVLLKVNEQIKNLSLKWDMLYFGCNHTWGQTKQVSDNILELQGGSYCWHCVGINQEHHNMIEHLLNLPAAGPFDWLTAHNTQLNPDFHCYAVWPTVAIQKPGMSYVLGQVQNYTEFFKAKGTS